MGQKHLIKMHSTAVSTAVMSASHFEVRETVWLFGHKHVVTRCDNGQWDRRWWFWCPRAVPPNHPIPPRLSKPSSVYTADAWSNSGQIFLKPMKGISKLKPLLSIRVGFLQLRRSIYIKRVKSVARNESELNAEFGACNHFYKSRTWKGWESWRLWREEGFASLLIKRLGLVSSPHLVSQKPQGFLRTRAY